MRFPKQRNSPRRSMAIVALLLLSFSAAAGGADEALSLYDAGRYDEAQTALERLDADGGLTGPLLYRLFYCHNLKRDPRAPETLERARRKLEEELRQAPDIERYFYLSNALANIGDRTEQRRIAAQATAALEQGTLSRDESALSLFRTAKLYADQENVEQASEWYARAVTAYEAEGADSSQPYLQWASRYLSQRSFDEGDYENAVRYLAHVSHGADKSGIPDLERLAVAQVRLGRYAEAAETWRRAEKLDPPNSDRPRYSGKLATLAAGTSKIPSTNAEHLGWSLLSKEELETTMKEQAELVKVAITRAKELRGASADLRNELAELELRAKRLETDNGSRKDRKELRKEIRALEQQIQDITSENAEEIAQLQGQIDSVRPVFVAAALEFAVQGHSLREAAFFGGFAPLIFRTKDWDLSQ